MIDNKVTIFFYYNSQLLENFYRFSFKMFSNFSFTQRYLIMNFMLLDYLLNRDSFLQTDNIINTENKIKRIK